MQLKLDPPPRVAVLPLGTGNDLSLSFGWGNAFLPSWLRNFGSVYNMLRRVADAQPRELDCWRITMSAGDAPVLLPRCTRLNLQFAAWRSCDRVSSMAPHGSMAEAAARWAVQRKVYESKCGNVHRMTLLPRWAS